MNVLIVVTSHTELGATGKATGYYLPEVTHPYTALAERGVHLDIASLKGGLAPLDQKSLKLDDPVNKAFWENPARRAQLENSLKLADLNPADYDGIFFAGGHGTMWDFKDDAVVKDFVREIYENGGVVGAVCHGPAALVDVKLSSGDYLVDGKRISAFSDAEEEAAGLTAVVPFLLETELVKHGAQYTKAGLWQVHVVTDGRLVTGQNPASAAGVGAAMAKLIASRPTEVPRRDAKPRREAEHRPI